MVSVGVQWWCFDWYYLSAAIYDFIIYAVIMINKKFCVENKEKLSVVNKEKLS